MNDLKKFFKKKKAFAGTGHKLNEPSAPKPNSSKKEKEKYNPPVRSGLTDESKQAAAAALARLEGKKTDPNFNTYVYIIISIYILGVGTISCTLQILSLIFVI